MARLLSVILALAVFAPSHAFAAKSNLKFGKIELNPYYKLAETYDSNIYMVPRDLNANRSEKGGGVRGAWITENTLGIKFKLPLSKTHIFDAGYEVQALNYSTMSKTNDAYNQKANLGYEYKGPSGFSGKLGDAYINTTDPAFSESAAREHRWQNTMGAAGEYGPEGGNLFAGASFDHATHKYVNYNIGQLLNRYEQTYGFKAGYKIQPKTRAYVGYRRGIMHYAAGTKLKDNKNHYLDFGVEGDLAAKLKGKVETGFGYRNYDDQSSVTKISRNWTVNSQLNYKPVERAQATLSFMRSLQEAIYAGNRFYVSNALTLGYMHKLPMKLTADASFGMMIDKYSDQASGTSKMRRDDNYQGKLSLEYALLDYMGLGLSYLRRQKFSTYSGEYNYKDNQVSLNAKLSF